MDEVLNNLPIRQSVIKFYCYIFNRLHTTPCSSPGIQFTIASEFFSQMNIFPQSDPDITNSLFGPKKLTPFTVKYINKYNIKC